MAVNVEKIESRKLANWILDRQFRDPDDNESILARQLLRADEEIEQLRAQLAGVQKERDYFMAQSKIAQQVASRLRDEVAEIKREERRDK